MESYNLRSIFSIFNLHPSLSRTLCKAIFDIWAPTRLNLNLSWVKMKMLNIPEADL